MYRLTWKGKEFLDEGGIDEGGVDWVTVWQVYQYEGALLGPIMGTIRVVRDGSSYLDRKLESIDRCLKKGYIEETND